MLMMNVAAWNVQTHIMQNFNKYFNIFSFHMRITLSLLQNSTSFTNCLGDREIDLRRNRIPIIENLTILQDSYDTIDLSNNEIRELDNFPLMKRCKSILLSSNLISRIGKGISAKLPNLKTLILNSNPHLTDVAQLSPLRDAKGLRCLSLIDCPVTKGSFYREKVIKLLPQLKVLDFQKVVVVVNDVGTNVSSFDGNNNDGDDDHLTTTTTTDTPSKRPLLSEEERERLRKALEGAKTLEEVHRLEKILSTGYIPE